ncbi:MAG: DUF924 family protein [Devosia sp.]
MDRKSLREIYRFWFGTDPNRKEVDNTRLEFWMRRKDETDREIDSRFGHFIRPAADLDWAAETLAHEEALALVVLFDQFPRNIHRASGEAFAYDAIARRLVRRLTADGWDCFSAMERFLLGLPLVHHEDIASQDEAVMLAAREAIVVPDASKPSVRFSLDQAIRHRDVIQRFGRFPHRNAMLGRESTAEELEFMAGAVNGRGF